MRFALLIIVAAIIGLLVVTEIGLRSLFGFGNPLTYIGDEKIGYLLTPSQRTRRFGNRIEINQYSMRGANIQQVPSPSSLRILLLGDSIANGGWWTDQDRTISNLMMGSLTFNLSTQVEVLNASANSWGPRNELAYLQRFGSFGAKAVVLLINTDDLFSTAPTSLPVGRDRNYPSQKPPFALAEVFNRYILKPKPIPGLKEIQNENGEGRSEADRVSINLEAVGQIQEFTRANNAQFLLAMTPLLREIGEPGPRDYEIKARQRLQNFTQSQGITYIDFLPIFNSQFNSQNPKALYHDHIHFNLKGNQLISEKIQQKLTELFQKDPKNNSKAELSQPK